MKKPNQLLIGVLALLLASCGTNVEKPTVKLSKNTMALSVGQKDTLSVKITPNNLKEPKLVWDIDTSIATIDNGLVTALAKGNTDIKVFLDMNNNSVLDRDEPFDVCVLSVMEEETNYVPVTSVLLNQSSLTLSLNKQHNLSATVQPENATIRAITWLSEDSQIVSVSDGLLKANKVGNSLITAFVDENENGQLDSGEKFATCNVTVNNSDVDPVVYVTSVEIGQSSIVIIEGQEQVINAEVAPKDATFQTLTWLSSNNDIATISAGKLIALKEGNAVVTAYVDENNNNVLDNDEHFDTVDINAIAKSVDPQPDEDPIPARGEPLPINNKSVAGPKNTTPVDIKDWVDFDFYSSLAPNWSFIMGNNKRDTSSDFYAENSGGGFKFSQLYYGLQSPLLNSWLKTEVRLTVSQVNENSQNAKLHKDKPIFHIYSYDINGYYIGMNTYEQRDSFANIKEIKFYIANPKMAYFEIRLNAFPTKGGQCYNFGVSQISVKGWPYEL